MADRGRDDLSRLADVRGLQVKQQVERLEMWLGIEQRNHYTVRSSDEMNLYFVEEESPFWVRFLLRAMRPLTLNFTYGGPVLLRLRKPFRFFFDAAELFDAAGRKLGSIEREFSLIVRTYSVRDARGTEIYSISGAFWRPWTFKITRGGQDVAEIKKRWRGLLREALTDADKFEMTFPAGANPSQKALLMAAMFLIDLSQFEDNQKR